MPRRERMTSVDTAWLRMDRPTNLMMIVGVLMFEAPLDLARVRSCVEERLLRYHRFRQRPEQDATGAYWADVPEFNIERHVTRARLPKKGGEAALKAFVAKLIREPLPAAHPLWQFTVVENYHGGAALVTRIHHAYADGIALIGVMFSLTDPSPEGGAATAPAPEPAAESAHDASPLEQLFAPLMEVVRNPGKTIDYAKTGAALLSEGIQLAMLPDDSPTRFKGKPGLEKCVAWSAPIPLEEVKAVGRAFGFSVNDVLLACVAGALGAHLRARGDATAGVELRALVPVNLRPQGKEHKLGNRFGLVALELPLGIVNPIARLREIHRRMEGKKRSYQAVVTMGLLGLVGVCPKPIQDQVLDLLANKATAVMTNVPGPQAPLYLVGSRLSNMMFWVPQSGDIGMGVSILSYAGSVQFGLVTDAGLTPDPDAIVAGFGPELERLILTLLMEPWDSHRPPEIIEAELEHAAI